MLQATRPPRCARRCAAPRLRRRASAARSSRSLLPGVDGDEAAAVAERCRGALDPRSRSHGIAARVLGGRRRLPGRRRRRRAAARRSPTARCTGPSAPAARRRAARPRDSVVALSWPSSAREVAALLDAPDAHHAGLPADHRARHRPRRGLRGARALPAPSRRARPTRGSRRRAAAGSARAARRARSRAALAVPGRPDRHLPRAQRRRRRALAPEVAARAPARPRRHRDRAHRARAVRRRRRAASSSSPTLRERGARIALDDAGAGYAGLQQLVRIAPGHRQARPLADRRHRRGRLEARAAARRSPRFAGTTGAAVCAEGVEELAELRALAGFDVTYAQGYALARPAPAWPAIPAEVAEAAASADDHGMRLAGARGRRRGALARRPGRRARAGRRRSGSSTARSAA